MSIDSPEAAQAFTDALDYPMFVVTCAAGREASGCLAGFVTQCSIDPPRLLVCISVANHTHRVAAGAGGLAVHLLGRDQAATAAHFGTRTGDEEDKLAGLEAVPGVTGAPRLADCAAWAEGPVVARHLVGDHEAFVIDVVASGEGPRPAQLTFRAVEDLPAGHPA